MLNKILDKLLDHIFAALEPRIEALVKEAVNDAAAAIIHELDEKADNITNSILAALRKLPVVGAFL